MKLLQMSPKMRLVFLVQLIILHTHCTIAWPALSSETGSRISLPNETSSTRLSNTSTSASPTPTPFWPTAILPQLPSEFKDIPAATLSCWNSWANYILRNQMPSNPGLIAEPTFSTSVSSYPTPLTTLVDQSYCSEFDNVVAPIGLTTLCDGVPRAEDVQISTSWSLYNYTYTGIDYASTFTTWIAGTTIPGYENPAPSCEVAEPGSSVCQTLVAAYSWWRSGHPTTPTSYTTPDPTNTATATSTTPTKSIIETLVTPQCVMTITPPASAKPSCQLALPSDPIQEIWYWPTPLPTGADFCNASWTPSTTIPPTNPAHPNTAIISGHTLTSPTIYQFIRGATIWTLSATKSKADNGHIGGNTEIWSASTVLPTATILTAAHAAPSDLLSVTEVRHRRYPTYYYNHDFALVDIFTQRAAPYFSTPDNPKTRPPGQTRSIIQAYVTHTLGVVVTELAQQNGFGKDCVWVREKRADFSPTDAPEVENVDFTRNQFRDIAKGEQSGGPVATGVPAPGPSPPLCRV